MASLNMQNTHKRELLEAPVPAVLLCTHSYFCPPAANAALIPVHLVKP